MILSISILLIINFTVWKQNFELETSSMLAKDYKRKKQKDRIVTVQSVFVIEFQFSRSWEKNRIQ